MWKKLFCLALLPLATSAWASDEVLASKAWVRESVPGQTSSSLQLNLTAMKPAVLVGVSSPRADAVEIRKLSQYRGKISARTLTSVRLPRNRTLAFGDRSIALMMVGLRQPLKVGEQIPVSLTVEFQNRHARVVDVMAEVLPLELSYEHYSGHDVYDHR